MIIHCSTQPSTKIRTKSQIIKKISYNNKDYINPTWNESCEKDDAFNSGSRVKNSTNIRE